MIVLACLLAVAATALRAQTPPPPPAATAAPLDWDSDDSARVAFLTAHGRAYTGAQLIVWAPPDSLDARWLPAFVDSLATSLGAMRRLMGGPYAWQRIAQRPVTFYLSPGRFVSHASGAGAVFISLTRVRSGSAPYLHEAAHELLAPPAPFSPFEYADSIAADRAAAAFPQWLSEGFPDYLAQATASATGFHEGDVFAIGGLAKVDSTCARDSRRVRDVLRSWRKWVARGVSRRSSLPSAPRSPPCSTPAVSRSRSTSSTASGCARWWRRSPTFPGARG